MTKQQLPHRIILALLLMDCCTVAKAQSSTLPRYHVTDLGTLGGNSSGYGINNSGQVAGFSNTLEEVPLGQSPIVHAFLWKPDTPNGTIGTLHDLGSPGVTSYGYGINDRGQVTGIVQTEAGFYALLWTPTIPNATTGTQHAIGTRDRFSEGRAINGGGQITGHATREAGYESRAFIWNSTAPVGATDRLHFIDFQSRYAVAHTWGYGINDGGRVTGAAWFHQSGCCNEHAFLWTPSENGNAENGTLQDLGTLGGLRSTGFAINANGLVTGEADTTELRHAFLYDGAMHDLGTLGGVVSVGHDINLHGHVTGWSLTEDHRIHSFLYTSGTGMVDLNSLIDSQSGWELQEARGINDIGKIVGTGLLNGLQRAFLLTPVPEPAMLTLFAIGLAWCAMGNKRRRKRSNVVVAAPSIHARCHRNVFATKATKQVFARVAAASLLACSGPANAEQPFFMGLGDLPGGSIESAAHGVSADGSVIVGASQSASGNEAFRWTQADGLVGLGGTSVATDVSADGSVIVGQWGAQAFRWTQASGKVGLGDFPGGAFRSFAGAVSADGSVVAGIGWDTRCTRGGCANIWPGARWTEAGIGRVSMHVVPVFDNSLPLDISADGDVIVAGRFEAEKWTLDGGMTPLGDLPGGNVSSRAHGVSADGSVIVGVGNAVATYAGEAFRWTQESGMVGLGILPGFDSSLAQDVSADGSIVVGTLGVGTESTTAFIWDATHGMRNLRDELVNSIGLGTTLAGWTLSDARAISADGRFVVGYGMNPGGNTEAWIARLQPAPMLPGDFNNDGTVDAADYIVWRKGLGTVYTPGDFSIWRASYGQTAGSGAAGYPLGASAESLSAAVPEPATALLIVMGGVIALAMRSTRAAQRESRCTSAANCERHRFHGSNSFGTATYSTLTSATCVVLALASTAAAATYSFVNVADVSGPFSGFRSSSINDSGTVAFVATLDAGGVGVFIGNGGPSTLLVDDSGQFSDFGNLIVPTGVSINNGGQVAFFGSLDAGGWGIFTSSGGPVITIADTNGPVSSFAGGSGGPSINDSGTVAFVAGLDAGGVAVLTGNGGPLATIADSSRPGSLSQIMGVHSSINNGGTVTFVANFDAGGSVERGIFTSSGGPATLIVDGRGPLFGGSFNSTPAVNDGGTVTYSADYDGAASGRGIFIGAGTTIADASGLFSRSFGNRPAINNRGTVAFNAGLDAGGSGIFTGPDPNADKVIRTGDGLFGSTVTAVVFGGEINDNGDIPFLYGLANGSGGIAVAQRQPNAAVPSPIPQPGLHANASVEYRTNSTGGFTASDVNTAGIPGRAQAHASHPNFPTNTAFGDAFAEVPVVPITTDDLGKVGSRSYGEPPLPNIPGGPIDNPTKASAEARQVIKLMVPLGSGPQPVDIDMTLHVEGSLQQRLIGLWECEAPCDPTPRPQPGQLTTSVIAEVNTYTSSGKITQFEASATLDWSAAAALKLTATGPLAVDFTPLVQPTAGIPGGSSVSSTQFFDDMLLLAAGEEFTVEVILRTEVFNHYISTRLGGISIADFFNSGAVTFSTDTPGVTIELVPDGLQGDFNNDGTVDAADYVVWRKGMGTTYNQNDYGLWRAHFGASLGPGSGSAIPSAEPLSAAVPEPAPFVLLTLAAAGVYLRRHRTLARISQLVHE